MHESDTAVAAIVPDLKPAGSLFYFLTSLNPAKGFLILYLSVAGRDVIGLPLASFQSLIAGKLLISGARQIMSLLWSTFTMFPTPQVSDFTVGKI